MEYIGEYFATCGTSDRLMSKIKGSHKTRMGI
jgi:hypothetical protein